VLSGIISTQMSFYLEAAPQEMLFLFGAPERRLREFRKPWSFAAVLWSAETWNINSF